jgi:hypothetical protein
MVYSVLGRETRGLVEGRSGLELVEALRGICNLGRMPGDVGTIEDVPGEEWCRDLVVERVCGRVGDNLGVVGR